MHRILFTSLFLWMSALSALADIRLPKLFGDHMVLQRRKPVPVWGWAEPGERLTVSFSGQVKKVKADKNGRWRIDLNPMDAGGPFVLTVQSKTDVLTIQDVLVGEVWICSGQSNMEMSVSGAANATEEIQNAKHPLIRHFKVKRATSVEPLSDVAGEWQICSPATAGAFTAVGYFFARDLLNQLNVPIGLVNTSWGATHSETWTSREALESDPDLRAAVARIPPPSDTLKSIQKEPNLYGTLLYNAMLHPLIPMAMQGVIWYQGESNTSRAYQYRTTFQLLIQDWRTQWNRRTAGAGQFPFLFVQLASYKAENGDSQKGSTWAELREAQAMALKLPNTGMAVASDVGETQDIHPKNKQDIGKRLAAEAMRVAYQSVGMTASLGAARPTMAYQSLNEVSRGPTFSELTIQGDRAVVRFQNIGTGLVARDKYGYAEGFEVAGNDQRFYYAQANIQGERVEVFSPKVTNPVAVRYGWADDNGDVNLYNREGFPAVPFRTDSWKGVTEGNSF